MDSAELKNLQGDIDELIAGLALERWRHVSGVEATPALGRIFQAHSRAAHRDTVEELRAMGQEALARRVAELRAERLAAEAEEAWRAAESAAQGRGPDGLIPLAEAMAQLPGERDRGRRQALGRAVAEGSRAAAPRREEGAEIRARVRAESGLIPDWEGVVAADRLLSESDDAYRDVLTWLARREGLAPRPAGDLERGDLLYLLSLHSWSGLFQPGMLALSLRESLTPLGLERSLRLIRIDDGDRPGRWPGAHALGTRVSFRRRGGAGDWLDLFDAAGRALAAALGPPGHRRDPALSYTIGALLSGLILDGPWLTRRLGVERKQLSDLMRVLSLRRLFTLRARAAACRVASEVERGTSGQTWAQAHREAFALAALADWPEGLAARDADGPDHLAALRGAARAERLRRAWVERFDEDWWRNPRSAEAVAGALAGSAEPDEPSLPDALGPLLAAMG